jgi:hypothetical protein
MKVDRSTELRIEIERTTMDSKRKLVLTDEDANRRLARILQEREVKAQQARTATSENAQKTARKFEEWKYEQEKKRREVDERFAKNEECIQKVREDQQKQQLLRTIAARLKQDERDSNARHQENLKKRKIRVMRERQEALDARLEKQKEEKRKIQTFRLTTVSKMEADRAAFEADFKETIHQADRSEDSLKKLAKKFNINLEDLRVKLLKRPGTSYGGRGLPGMRPESQFSYRSEPAPVRKTTFRIRDEPSSAESADTSGMEDMSVQHEPTEPVEDTVQQKDQGTDEKSVNDEQTANREKPANNEQTAIEEKTVNDEKPVNDQQAANEENPPSVEKPTNAETPVSVQ